LNQSEKKVREELDGFKAWQHANYITQFMRTPGSTGRKKTTELAREQLEKYGLDNVYIIKYPSKEDGTEDLQSRGWDVNDARLDIIEPENKIITSYSEAPTCIQHWSIPTPPEGVIAELIDVGIGVNESDYEGKEIKGKIVLAAGDAHAEGNSQAYRLAVEKYGAIGLVTDNLIYLQPPFRLRENHPDAIVLLRVPSRKETGWAFTISHTQGQYLRSMLKQGPVKLKAYIDASNFDTQSEELVGEITGTEYPEQQIWFVGHNSGTKPGGNCAGGVGLWIENARTIMSLVKQGKVPKPKRTIKFLLGAEGGGLNAYLTARPEDEKKVIAALVYCSVGNDQNLCNSSLILYKSAESVPSFINDLCIDTINNVSKDALPPFKDETRDIKLIRFNVLPYTPWSDNSRLMRLMVPSPLFMSWPDQHFHTQFLTAEKVDPAVLKRCGEVTTSVALMIANAGIKEARYIAKIVETKGISRFMNVSTQTFSEMMDAITNSTDPMVRLNEISKHRKGEIDYLADRSIGALESIKKLEEDVNLHEDLAEHREKILKAKKSEKEKIEDYKQLLLKEVQ
jgi:hypothetical protein